MGACKRARARACADAERACDAALRCAGPPLFAFGVALVLGIARETVDATARELRRRARERLANVVAACATACAVNALFNHAMCAWTKPGTPKDERARRAMERRANETRREDGGETGNGLREAIERGRFCETCDTVKPDLCHHCSVCKRCVLKMDHHCPWVMNCVGARNYRYFFNFIAYAWVGCAFATIGGAFVLFGANEVGPTDAETLRRVIFVTVMATAVLCALGFMVYWQAYLALTGQTTIDYYNWMDLKQAMKARGLTPPMRPPFDQGAAKNWQEAFDERGKFWFLTWAAPRFRAHSGSGVYYEAYGPRQL
jgi:palmitoyltransferase